MNIDKIRQRSRLDGRAKIKAEERERFGLCWFVKVVCELCFVQPECVHHSIVAILLANTKYFVNLVPQASLSSFFY